MLSHFITSAQKRLNDNRRLKNAPGIHSFHHIRKKLEMKECQFRTTKHLFKGTYGVTFSENTDFESMETPKGKQIINN